MYQRIISCILLFAMLAALMLSGCAGTEKPQTAAETTAAAALNDRETAPVEETAEPVQIRQPRAPDVPAVPAEKPEPAAERTPEAEIDLVPRPLGGLLAPQVPQVGKEVSEEEIQEIERSMRDYTGPQYNLSWEYYPRNQADSFVYYDLMNRDEQAIYDAILLTTVDPYAEKFHAYCTTSMDPSSDEFYQAFCRVSQCMSYDHPELFWLHIKDGPRITYCYGQDSDGEVYFFLTNMSEQVMGYIYAFNRNTEAFLAMVNDFSSEVNTARQVHDLLLYNVSYDHYGLNNNIEDPLRYTAYAAIVENGRGEAFSAVCGGYANAFLYLMQMLKIEGAVVLGDAGLDGDTELHAWNLMNLDGVWTEVDVTWDDIDLKNTDGVKSPYQCYYDEAANDPWTNDRITHAFFCIPTWKMTDFKGIPEYDYQSRDGKYVFHLIGNSNHYRLENENEYAMGSVVARLPVAK